MKELQLIVIIDSDVFDNIKDSISRYYQRVKEKKKDISLF